MSEQEIKRDGWIGWLLWWLNTAHLVWRVAGHEWFWAGLALTGVFCVTVGLRYNAGMQGMLWMRQTWKLP
jgi:hypothetical protein